MKNFRRYKTIIISLLAAVLFLTSCKDFLNPDQEINITEDNLFDDWYEYRSAAMGLYGLQQQLTEQILILGELRGDLLSVTENADADMVEIYNFNVSKENKYVSPTNFFKLISASNNLVRVLKRERPEVMDRNSPVNNFDKLYGEAICMRAWAYFNAVRIYGKVPFIHESLTSIDEVESYLNSSDTYIDSVDIVFGRDGYSNDTIYNNPITLEKKYYDEKLIIDYFTNELETKVKDVGVNHSIDNNDDTWEVTIWNQHAMNTLLGQMYLTQGDLTKAANYFEKIVYLPSDNNRYQLDETFSNMNWRNIFGNVDTREHIYTLWYNKGNLQQNDLQKMFEPRTPHQYMLKPSRQAILKWETIWDNYSLSVNNSQPWKTRINNPGTPGDFYRGYGVSYVYLRDGEPIPEEDIEEMLYLKSFNDFRSAHLITQDADTVVWKYSWNKNVFDQDANFIIYRAAAVHLWLAEVYIYWAFERNQNISTFTTNAINIVNNGRNYTSGSRPQMGVRGRVGFGGSNDGIKVGNINYVHNPFTNEVIDYIDVTGNFVRLQELLEDYIIDEKARELAFEGERFYDLMRVAKRRNDPSYLAKIVSQKYPTGKREEIYNLLLNEENWYINYFD
jgi:starch-binding outer membrane protein, SusD/RagB family